MGHYQSLELEGGGDRNLNQALKIAIPPDDVHFQALRDPDGFQNPEDGDRIGGGDEGAEEQAVGEGDRYAQAYEEQPGEPPDDERRGHHARRRQ